MTEFIILSEDPFGNANIFGNPVVEKICHNSTQWVQLIADFDSTLWQAIISGLVIGFVVGISSFLIGRWWRNHGNS